MLLKLPALLSLLVLGATATPRAHNSASSSHHRRLLKVRGSPPALDEVPANSNPVQLEERDLSSSNTTHTKRQGQFTEFSWYDTQTGNAGACGRFLLNSEFVVARRQAEFNAATDCGRAIRINYGGKSAVAIIEDSCPGCHPGRGFDLSRGLFEFFEFDAQRVGVIHGTWEWADGAGGGPAPPPPSPTPDPPAPPPPPPSSEPPAPSPTPEPPTSEEWVPPSTSVRPSSSVTPSSTRSPSSSAVPSSSVSGASLRPTDFPEPGAVNNLNSLGVVFVEMGSVAAYRGVFTE
ncbi:hypothetical protein CC1G_02273 [Coprinopsis cinerea okayama7|uniref:RlpA-like protein double-psi beta-barrel domain-containing protein n=1 Tax=Coprinopsis cinerea (strain Okayama-7 / 130 / ATCC MYA-4618 / FGSC 9003) TaxID=240176 RepID=A8N7L6_COPC7|nr:hypothetical protein CC1G_02273 [Coprinopsis cinerea okayama7\|eukprot:XP_001830822.1 hypothetical protein CC1G_02273 [Coprinopsis cinerea okayama7\